MVQISKENCDRNLQIKNFSEPKVFNTNVDLAAGERA